MAGFLSPELGVEGFFNRLTSLEKQYEKVSGAGQSPHHEATHGSIYDERFAART
jgi:hypothetical protein